MTELTLPTVPFGQAQKGRTSATCTFLLWKGEIKEHQEADKAWLEEG